jgi:chaperonin GroEL
VDYNLNTADQAVSLLNATLQAGRSSLLIVAPDVGGAALQLLVMNHAQPADKRKVAVLATTITLLGEERTWAVNDLALLSGATVFGTPSGRTVEKATAADLGTALRAEFSSEKLAVVAEPQRRAEVQGEIADLRSRLDRLSLDDEGRPAVERRLAALSGGMGVLKVGDFSKLSTELRKNQAERTFKVLSAVQRSGLVAGAGAAYVHCIAAVKQAAAEQDLDDDVRLGMRVLADALAAPMRQLLKNAGVEPPAVIIQRVVDGGVQATYGWEQQKVVDAHAAGVVDAAGVLVTVLQSATSGAIMALSTDAVVYHKKPVQSLEP